MSHDAIPILGKPKFCDTCGKRAHPFNTKCGYADLVERVSKLLEANRAIPAILQANVEAVETANTFRRLANGASRAVLLCEKTVMEFDNGTQIWKRFQERLEEEGVQTEGGELGNA